MYVDPSGYAPWWSWVLSGLQLVAGVALCFVPGLQGAGASLAIGGATGLIMNAVEPQIAQAIGGVGSISSGYGAISTGVSLCAFGPWGIAAGVTLMVIGAGTMAFGANEIVDAAFGVNYIQEWTGMSDSTYAGLYLGLNIASAVGTIAGNIGMRIASNRILNNIIQNPSKITNYKLWQIKTYGRYTNQWSVGTLNKGNAAGKGYVLRQTYDGRYIQWHPASSTWHINQNPYWKISSGALGKMWFDYITGLRFYP